MIKIIGIDISKETFDAVFLEGNEKYRHYQFSNDGIGFHQLLKEITEDDKVIMEASGPYYLRLAHFLFDSGIPVAVVNPLIIRRFCQMRMMRAKTDKKDALMIALYGQQENPAIWVPDAEVSIFIKQIHTATEQLDKQITALKNQLNSFKAMHVVDKEVIKSLQSIIRKLERERDQLDKRMVALVKQHYTETYKAVTSIPGIGPQTASMIIAITNNFQKFAHYKQLISYVGLSPRIYTSGTSVKGKAKICKMGMAKIRKLLYLCSWSAKRFNAHCKELYERLKANGKPERVIKIAIANKLLRQAFTIGKNQSEYQKNYTRSFAY